MIVSLTKVLSKAQRGGYAVGAFNINNLETLQAVLAAAQAEQSPAIISTSEGAIAYAGMEELGALVRAAAAKASVPLVFHLDHGKDEALVVEVIKSGLYSSVMFDGSALPYEENVAATSRIVALARPRQVSVEAELGAIAGIEDFVSVADRDAHLTDPDEARDFVRRTGCDALAVAIGTKHGAYKFKTAPKLDFGRLEKIAALVRVPLVLHGASAVPAAVKKQCVTYGCKIADARGVPDAAVRKAVSLGIRKVNVDTDLRIAFDAGIRKFLKEKPEVIDPREILKPAKDLMEKVIRHKMNLFGSSGRA